MKYAIFDNHLNLGTVHGNTLEMVKSIGKDLAGITAFDN
jgi:hypothetical protein